MYKSETFSRRGSLRSLRSAPLLSTVLESTLSLTRIHPIASLELPGLDYAVQSQTAISAHHRELASSLRSNIATITASTSTAQLQTTYQKNRLTAQGSIRHTEVKRNLQPKRALSRKLKPHLVADTVKQYISRAQRIVKGTQEQQPNMEFLRGVYAFMQVSRSSSKVAYDGNENRTRSTTTVVVPTPIIKTKPSKVITAKTAIVTPTGSSTQHTASMQSNVNHLASVTFRHHKKQPTKSKNVLAKQQELHYYQKQQPQSEDLDAPYDQPSNSNIKQDDLVICRNDNNDHQKNDRDNDNQRNRSLWETKDNNRRKRHLISHRAKQS